MTFLSTTDHIYDSGKNFWGNLDKLIVEKNCLPKEILNKDETSLFWKQMSGRTSIHKEAESMPGCKIYVSTLCDICAMTETPYGMFLRTYPHH